jgi:hypothetical protein
MRHVVPVVVAALSGAVPLSALGWGNGNTHPDLTEQAATAADERGGHLGELIRDDLGFANGLDQSLALQLGLDDDVDRDIGRSFGIRNYSRLERNLNLTDRFAPVPDGVRAPLNDGCETATDRASCANQLSRQTVLRLLRLGAYAEDNPNPRARHHFHDPERAHTPPAGSHGLDNNRFAVDAFLADAITSFFRGGDSQAFLGYLGSLYPGLVGPGTSAPASFDLTGLSAPNRALNVALGSTNPSGESPRNLFALPDGERYLYRALTSEFPDQREGFLALHFLAVGHVLHLLEDMSSPPHLRNDFIEEHVYQLLNGLEPVGDRPQVNLDVVAKVGASPGVSLPVAAISDSIANPSAYIAALPALDRTGFDAVDFWDRGAYDDPSGPVSQLGLAEFVHDRFVSSGSITNLPASPYFQAYAKPQLPSCADPDDTAGSGSDQVWVAELPERDLVTGTVQPATPQRYLSSPWVPHLAACRLHAVMMPLTFSPPAWQARITDDSVQRDYFEILWSLAIQWSARFLEFLYEPRLAVIALSENEFLLANRSTREIEIDPSTVEIVYETLDADTGLERRVSAPASCGAGANLVLPPAPEPGGEGVPFPSSCFLPSTLDEPPIRTDEFWVVARGRQGSRGAAGEPEELETSDFVVVFDRVLPRIAFTGIRIADPDTDVGIIADVFAIDVDLARTLGPGDPGPLPQNLTGPLRASLGLAAEEIAELDLGGPTAQSHGPRIALLGDRTLTIEGQFLTEPWLLDRTRTEEPPLEEIDFPDLFSGFRFRGVLWDRTPGSSLLTYQTHRDTGERFIVTHDMESGSVSSQPTTAQTVWLESRFGDVLSGVDQRSTDFDVVLLDADDGEITHLVDTDAGLLVACDPSCPRIDSSDAIQSDFSPNGRTLAFVDIPGSSVGTFGGELKLIDALNAGGAPDAGAAVRLLSDAAGDPLIGEFPVWSPDGRWIAYFDGNDIRVVDATGGSDPIRITATRPDSAVVPTGSMTWLTTLRLPDPE